MAAKTQITNKGLELLASSSKATGQHWWIGWYALAFVPDELQEEDGEKLSPSMTKLTENGDIIYNIFQGDMNGDGYQTTKASSKFKSVNYDSNIKKNYRYVLDEDGKNNLVTFVDGTKGLKGAYVYPGVEVNTSRDNNGIGYTKSKIPLPAPLLYTGVKAAGEGWSINGMNIFLGSGNDSIDKFYPVDENVTEMNVPRVSADFRNYEGYKNGLPKLDDGEESYDDALNGTLDGVDFDGWFPSVNTYTQNGETDMDEDYNQYCHQYWKILSISNFNKYCAPVNASGLLYDENTGCRNMAKATKYFPISDYSVTSTAKTADNEYATGIKLKVQLKLNGNAEDDAYFKDVEGDADNVATLNPTPKPEDQVLFNSQKVSFKFNRIGIYAVPMRQYGCSGDSAEMKAQYQIDTEAEPVLFAVCEWDSPVTLSDSGEGLSEFQSDIFVDLSAAVDDSSVIRESAVFYNLYEDDAIDWYKNQLVANAAMGEAIINMQIEMGYIRDQKNAKGCCPKSEEIKQNNKVSTGLRNLVDAEDYNSNSVRNRLAAEEGKKLDAVYSDKIEGVVGIGYPHETTNNSIHARKSATSDEYYAYNGSVDSAGHENTYSDAIIDEITYVGLSPALNYDGARDAVRIGPYWVRTKLFYEFDSFKKPGQNDYAYDYPDDQDTNEFTNGECSVVDYFGSGTSTRDTTLPYVTVTKTASGIVTDDDGQVTTGIIAGLSDIAEFVDEVNSSFRDYETKRVYTAYYYQGTSSRDYTGYQFKRTTTMTLPKVKLYNRLNMDDINAWLAQTGWRIPNETEWKAIDAAKTDEAIKKIRSSSKWPSSLSGGTGSVYPLGGVKSSQAGRSLITSDNAIYLGVAGDNLKVVKFDGTSFEVIGSSTPETQSSWQYVGIICIADAEKISDATPKYKLGYDSYALMEGSVSAGDHDFNAGKDSLILASAHYNSILGGSENKIADSHYNTILNGCRNELLGAVFSTVCGNNNVVKDNQYSTPSCRLLMCAEDTVVTTGVTSVIFAEESNFESVFQSTILGDALNINNVYDSNVIGQYLEGSRGIYYSDVIAYSIHHLPATYMSRATLTNDSVNSLPSSLQFDAGTTLHYSDITGYSARFWSKTSAPSEFSNIAHSRVALTGTGIIKTQIAYSDISADGFGYSGAANLPYRNSWFDNKTIESVNISHSVVKLYGSSIASNYIGGPAYMSQITFSDISLGYSIMQLSASSGGHKIDYGVVKLSESSIALCDCSYVYESGTKHYLSSSTIKFATLVGQMVSLSGATFNNLHIYGSLTLTSSINNQLILGGLDGTTIGPGNFSASNYISEFGSFITANSKNYPMIWSLGGIGLFMNKMVLGDNGVASSDKKAPSIGDVLTVVGTEDNMATVAWKSGGAAGAGSSDIIVFQDDGVMIPYKSGAKFMTFSAEPVSSATAVRYSLFQDGQFTTYTNGDVPLFKTPGSNQPYGLRPNGTNHIVWNTWYSIKEYSTFDTDADDASAHVEEIKNGISGQIATGINKLSTMVVVTNALVDGLVYEVTINIRANAACAVSETGTTVVGEPVGNMYAPGRYSTHFGLAFYKDNGENPSSTVTTKRWADSANSVGNYIVYPRFVPAYSGDDGTGFGPGTHTGYQAPVLATAKVYFVKVGEDVFIMGY